MRIILDTNVIVSALISNTGPPHAAYQAWLGGRFELVSSVDQIDEFRRISRYPKLQRAVSKTVFGELINALKDTTLAVRVPLSLELDDPYDAFLLGMAAASDADYLVTGDKRAGLIAMGHFGRTRILTPGVFVGEVLT